MMKSSPSVFWSWGAGRASAASTTSCQILKIAPSAEDSRSLSGLTFADRARR
jgi:hypothetical protein